MSSYKTKAIVLKSYKLGESDKIIKIFSRKDGVVSAVAKGSRKIKSKFGGRLELFNFVDLELTRGKNLDIITSVEILKNFKNIPLDFNKFILGELISEIILKTQSTDTEIADFLFKLIYVCFSEIDNIEPGDIDTIKKTACFFGAKFLKISGFRPI
jgi:DNA repair protein RecO (recombination protein O)